MEILATHIRPAPDPASGVRRDGSALLASGRVLVGVVLEVRGAEAVLGIGQHRVTAQASTALTVGQQLLLRVGTPPAGGGLVLQVLDGGSRPESGLLRLLRGVVGLDRPIGELFSEIGKALSARGAEPGAARAALDQLASHAFRPGSGGAELRQLLATAGLSYEATILDAAARAASKDELRSLLVDLKAQLLRQLEDLPAGTLRDAVSRAVAALEAEQLLNVARREAGEPLHWSFPVPDGDHWTTAHLLWSVHRDAGEDDRPESGEPEAQRIAVGVRFSRTGPVRIDAFLRPGHLTVRLLVERPEVAERIRADAAVLAESLSAAGRTVQLVVGTAPPDTVEIEARSMDIRYLREHHLMDVSG